MFIQADLDGKQIHPRACEEQLLRREAAPRTAGRKLTMDLLNLERCASCIVSGAPGRVW